MENKKITFVNFCVDIGRGDLPSNNTVFRSFDSYRLGMYENLDSYVPIVIYTSEKSVQLPNHRNNSNTVINHYTIENIKNDFPNYSLYENFYKKSKKDEIASFLYYYVPLVVLKIKKMIEVIEQNPFNSEMFFWMDSHFARGIEDQKFLYEEEYYLKMFENLTNKVQDKFLLFSNSNRPFGFFWGGTKPAIYNIYENYFDIFFNNLEDRLLTEELIFKIIYENNPELFKFLDISDKSSKYKIAVSEFLNNSKI